MRARQFCSWPVVFLLSVRQLQNAAGPRLRALQQRFSARTFCSWVGAAAMMEFCCVDFAERFKI
jgi:hypothetical protein